MAVRRGALSVASWSLEAKRYKPGGGGAGVKDTSRLISRLRHREFGVFVTTSHVGRQAYEEIRGLSSRSSSSAPLWISRTGDPLSVRSISKLVTARRARAGIEESAHALRHTVATRLVRDHAHDLVLVADILEHADVKTTRRYARSASSNGEPHWKISPTDRLADDAGGRHPASQIDLYRKMRFSTKARLSPNCSRGLAGPSWVRRRIAPGSSVIVTAPDVGSIRVTCVRCRGQRRLHLAGRGLEVGGGLIQNRALDPLP
jgi:Phage integrase family